ncbi:MAG: helix-turn-helix domain-containing protein [Desulfuromonadales bacterium]|nr:helix-turn-helix domain-containing protein [Desulfuromonadales bacterium]
MSKQNGYVSPARAAELLGLARQTVYVYIKAGKLRARRPRGTHWEVLLEDVEKMADGGIDVSGIWKDWRKDHESTSER